MATLLPLRAKSRISKINRGTRRGRYSKNVGSIREQQVRGHKHETVLAIRREKPSSIRFFMVIGIEYSLTDV